MSADSDSLSSFPRLSKTVRQQLLDQNDGLSFQTHYESRNSRESRTYTVEDGKLLIRARGKGAFGGSQYDNTWTASPDEVHRALYKHQHEFDYSEVNPKLPLKAIPMEQVALHLMPDEVVADLMDESSPEAQSRFAAWFEGLSTKEKLVIGSVVGVALIGGVAIYRFRRPIADRIKGTVAAVRKKLSRQPTDDEE